MLETLGQVEEQTRFTGVMENDRLAFTRNAMSATEFLRTSQASFAKPDTWEETFPIEGHGGQHLEILENFCDAILEGKELIAPADEGIHSVELANAMLYSSLTGEPVELPLDGAAFERELQKLVATSTFVKAAEKQVEADMSKSFA